MYTESKVVSAHTVRQLGPNVHATNTLHARTLKQICQHNDNNDNEDNDHDEDNNNGHNEDNDNDHGEEGEGEAEEKLTSLCLPLQKISDDHTTGTNGWCVLCNHLWVSHGVFFPIVYNTCSSCSADGPR